MWPYQSESDDGVGVAGPAALALRANSRVFSGDAARPCCSFGTVESMPVPAPPLRVPPTTPWDATATTTASPNPDESPSPSLFLCCSRPRNGALECGYGLAAGVENALRRRPRARPRRSRRPVVQVPNDAVAISAAVTEAGPVPEVVIEATYGHPTNLSSVGQVVPSTTSSCRAHRPRCTELAASGVARRAARPASRLTQMMLCTGSSRRSPAAAILPPWEAPNGFQGMPPRALWAAKYLVPGLQTRSGRRHRRTNALVGRAQSERESRWFDLPTVLQTVQVLTDPSDARVFPTR